MRKNFFKIGIIYSIGQIFSKAAAFLLIPIYTKSLGIEMYGQLALVDTLFDFILGFVIISIYSGYTRYYQEYDLKNKKVLKNTAINFAIIMAIFDISIVLMLGDKISSIILQIPNARYILILIVFRALLNQIIALLLREYDLKYEPRVTVITNLLNMILSMILAILFVVKFKRGVSGIYEAYVIVYAISAIILFLVNIPNYRLELNKVMLRQMLQFSSGMLPSCMASTVLNMSDRYFLKDYRSFEATGIYSIGYKFGMLIDPIFVGPFNQLFTPLKFDSWKKKNAHEIFNYMFDKYNLIGGFFIISISVFTKFILILFGMNEYLVAFKIVPFIILSYFIYGKAAFYSLGIQVKNKTYLDGFVMMIGGILNIILNMILIPKMGMYGAAIATIISYSIMNILYTNIGKKLYHIKYSLKTSIKVYSIVIIIFSIYYFLSLNNENLLFEFVIATIMVLLYILLSLLIKLVTIEELKMYIIAIIKKIKKN
ncbi:hypothetical protein ELS18_13805 [Clostridium perfringens]|uniref:lipopolysaccharide biosynthesis protein n=1 Tax=Clostridium perfringens TaxID=1502 RepID=UPI000F8DD5A1|nr:polysaccharide biosynthesis C-terminal domain-containing protein [Clostridium perfringens]RUR35233.1 hypothetical protein ELS18_13805 [Clostridium perfringens]